MTLEINDREKNTIKHALEVLEDELKTIRVKMDRREDKMEFRAEEEEVEELLRKVA